MLEQVILKTKDAINRKACGLSHFYQIKKLELFMSGAPFFSLLSFFICSSQPKVTDNDVSMPSSAIHLMVIAHHT